MIENYNLKLDDIYNDISKLLKEIDNNHKIENLKLAKDRNKYALMNLYISFISLSFSFGSFIGSIFGMNLNNYINKNDLSFLIVTLLIIIFMSFIIKIQFYYLKYI
jgi:magnesium transporter